jgi:hypothetical protein
VAAGPCVPVDHVPRRAGQPVRAARRRLVSGMISGIIPGSADGSWPGVTGAGLVLGPKDATRSRLSLASQIRVPAAESLGWQYECGSVSAAEDHTLAIC